MKTLGSILLAAGFLAGAYFSVARVDRVDWIQYGACAAVMFAGLVVLRVDRASTAAAGGERHDEDIEVLHRSLTSLLGKVAGFTEDVTDQAQLRVHGRIDAELMGDINSFVEARESMIPRFGMQSYADIMSPFANAERLLNRAWSASADGYVDEVRSCLVLAKGELERSLAKLGSARSEPSPA